MNEEQLPVVNFGKYKGKCISTLLADNDYIEWLKQQSWLENHKNIYNIIISIMNNIINKLCKDHDNLEIEQFKNVNVNGTINLLNSLEKSYIPQKFVFISSVSVYGLENGIMINENHNLNPKDPYSITKRDAEKIIQNWCLTNNVKCTILRLP